MSGGGFGGGKSDFDQSSGRSGFGVQQNRPPDYSSSRGGGGYGGRGGFEDSGSGRGFEGERGRGGSRGGGRSGYNEGFGGGGYGGDRSGGAPRGEQRSSEYTNQRPPRRDEYDSNLRFGTLADDRRETPREFSSGNPRFGDDKSHKLSDNKFGGEVLNSNAYKGGEYAPKGDYHNNRDGGEKYRGNRDDQYETTRQWNNDNRGGGNTGRGSHGYSGPNRDDERRNDARYSSFKDNTEGLASYSDRSGQNDKYNQRPNESSSFGGNRGGGGYGPPRDNDFNKPRGEGYDSGSFRGNDRNGDRFATDRGGDFGRPPNFDDENRRRDEGREGNRGGDRYRPPSRGFSDIGGRGGYGAAGGAAHVGRGEARDDKFQSSHRDNGFGSAGRRDEGFESRGGRTFGSGNDNYNKSGSQNETGFSSRNDGGFRDNRESRNGPFGGNERRGRRDDRDDWTRNNDGYNAQRNEDRGYQRERANNDGGFRNNRNGRDQDQGGNVTTFVKSDQGAPRAPDGWDTEDVSVDVLYQQDQENAEFFEGEDSTVNVFNAADDTRLSNWEHSGLDDHLIDIIINKCGYKKVRPIQAAVIPQVIAGQDIIGHAETGGGKSAAFALPIINSIIRKNKNKVSSNEDVSPYAIVIGPTRELCKQLFNTFKKFCHGTSIQLVLSYGQLPRRKTVLELSKGCDVIIGTPGRLMDLIESDFLELKYLKVLVLDEADMLMDNQHGGHLQRILQFRSMPKPTERQTLLFSATVSQEFQAVAGRHLKESYVYVTNGTARANGRVKQTFVKAVDNEQKNQLLCEMLKNEPLKHGRKSRTLVFVQTKLGAAFLATRLSQLSLNALYINGDHSQDQREDILKQFINGEIDFLIGTDLCHRGWDIPCLEHVIIYDHPTGKFDENAFKTTYIHRIGRTGRLHDGRSTSFVMESTDPRVCKALKEIVEEVGQTVPDWLAEMAEKAGYGGGGGSFSGGDNGGFGDFDTGGWTSGGVGFGSENTIVESSGFGFGAKSDNTSEVTNGFSSGFGANNNPAEETTGFSSGFGAKIESSSDSQKPDRKETESPFQDAKTDFSSGFGRNEGDLSQSFGDGGFAGNSGSSGFSAAEPKKENTGFGSSSTATVPKPTDDEW